MNMEMMVSTIMKAVLMKNEIFLPLKSAMALKMPVPTIRPTTPRVKRSVARFALPHTQSLSVTAVLYISLRRKTAPCDICHHLYIRMRPRTSCRSSTRMRPRSSPSPSDCHWPVEVAAARGSERAAMCRCLLHTSGTDWHAEGSLAPE